MLTEIYLKNYILIPELRLQFGKGLSALTGETGAGKSILVGALNLVFGKVTPSHIAFDDTRDTYIELTFRITPELKEVHDYLNELGSGEEDELIIAREFTASGRATAFLNGRKTSVSVLKDLHDLLIDFHHQRDQQKLLNPAFQLDLLDSYGKLLPLRSQYQGNLAQLRQSIRQLEAMQQAASQNAQLMDLYQFQQEELLAAALTENEDTTLEQEFELLSHAAEIESLSSELYQEFYEQEDSLYDRMTQAQNKLSRYTALSGDIEELVGQIGQGISAIEEVLVRLRALNGHISTDPQRLEDIRLRLDLINSLKTKYKVNTIAALLDYLKEITAQLSGRQNNLEQISALEADIQRQFTQVLETAHQLTDKRTATAGRLSADIQNNVRKLSIPDARLQIQIDKKTQDKIVISNMDRGLTETGENEIEFRFSANPGSPLQPLKAVVSGGELSRLLLAAKQSLSAVMPPRIIILDEIDTGIGGKTAAAMGSFIHELSLRHQVLCITHLAQIAAVADHHYLIEKKASTKKTEVDVKPMTGDTRQHEIARMLSGNITEASLHHAAELLHKE